MRLWDYEAFIFDLDGTLIDSGKYHSQAFADAVFEESGHRLNSSEHHEFFGSHSLRFSEELNQRYGLSLDPERVLEKKRKRVEQIFKAELFPGARKFLEHWFGKRKMALATNSPQSFVRPALEAADMIKYFECITTADDVVYRKPHPEIVETTIQRLEATPQTSLIFEDQLIGIEAARSAGANVIAVDNGQPVMYPVDVAVHT